MKNLIILIIILNKNLKNIQNKKKYQNLIQIKQYTIKKKKINKIKEIVII